MHLMSTTLWRTPPWYGVWGRFRGGQEGTDPPREALPGLPTLAVFSAHPGAFGLFRSPLKKGGVQLETMHPAPLPHGQAHGPGCSAPCLTPRTGLPGARPTEHCSFPPQLGDWQGRGVPFWLWPCTPSVPPGGALPHVAFSRTG